MLSYLHSFHAGNRADLHKHGGLLALLAAMRKDPEPITYIETHAGRGRYDLNAPQAKKTGEYLTGAVDWPRWRRRSRQRMRTATTCAIIRAHQCWLLKRCANVIGWSFANCIQRRPLLYAKRLPASVAPKSGMWMDWNG